MTQGKEEQPGHGPAVSGSIERMPRPLTRSSKFSITVDVVAIVHVSFYGHTDVCLCQVRVSKSSSQLNCKSQRQGILKY